MEEVKLKEIEIEVKPFKAVLKETAKAYKDIAKNKKLKTDKKIVFENIATLRKIITPERIKLLHVIKEEKPGSIYELATLLRRKWRAVANDIELLRKIGLIKLEKKHKPKEVAVPTVTLKRLNVRIML